METRLRGAAILSALALPGCSDVVVRSPMIPIFGSYFPTWIFCAVGGIVVAAIFRLLFVLSGIDGHLIAPPLVYLCLTVSTGIAFAMLWMGAS